MAANNNSTAASLFNRLTAPKPAPSARERAAEKSKRKNLLGGPRGAGVKAKTTTVKSVMPAQRLLDPLFRNQGFIVSVRDTSCLECVGCGGQLLGTKKSVLLEHARSKKHGAGKAKALRRIEKDVPRSFQTVSSLTRHAVAALQGELIEEQLNAQRQKGLALANADVPVHVTNRRWEVTETLMLAGVPLAKVDGPLGRTLEAGNVGAFTSATHMAQFIPLIVETERIKLRKVFEGHMGINFDGATWFGQDAFAMIGRKIDPITFEPVERLLALRLFDNAFTGENTASVVLQVLSRLYSIDYSLFCQQCATARQPTPRW